MKPTASTVIQRTRGTILSLLLLLCLVACGERSSAAASPFPLATSLPRTALPPARYQVTIRSNASYGPLPGEVLDLCLPQQRAAPHPGVILIHGGGWTGGDKVTDDPTCSYLASQGFVAASINYRLTPKYTWPAPLVDAQLAVRWLRSQAAQIGLDPKRLCSFGNSAGGHLAVFLGVLASIHLGDEAGVLAQQSAKVSCVVDEFGPTDLTALTTPLGRSFVQMLLGGATPQSNPTLYRDASPLFAVSAQSAPMLIIQGTQDSLVPESQSKVLQHKLEQVHVPVHYISYGGGHAFQGLNERQKDAIQAQILTFLVMQEQAEEASMDKVSRRVLT